MREGIQPSRSRDWPSWLAEGEEHLVEAARRAGTELGHGRGAARRVMVDGRFGVWRRNRHGGLLGNWFGDRYRNAIRLEAEMEVSEKLRAEGIDTPAILLAYAHRNGLFWRQHLVTEEVAEAETVFAARKQPAALQAAAELLEKLFASGLWATDLHPGNLLWQNRAGRCWLIDLAGSRFLGRPLKASEITARRARFARYFRKHGGEVPELFRPWLSVSF